MHNFESPQASPLQKTYTNATLSQHYTLQLLSTHMHDDAQIMKLKHMATELTQVGQELTEMAIKLT